MKTDAAFENVGLSARPMGMGGAYVALADDTSSIIWNPAGLVMLRQPEIALNYLELYGLVNYSFLAWASPIQNMRTIGVSLSSSSDSDGLYQELAFDISGAQMLTENLSIGLNVKYLSATASIGEISVGSGRGAAIDVGARYTSPDGQTKFGLAFPNLLARVGYSRNALKNAEEASYSEGLAREWRLGIATKLDRFSPRLSNATVALELANGNLIVGGEYVIDVIAQNAAAVRLGYRLTGGVSQGITVGLGYRFTNLQLDYSFVSGRYNSETSLFSVTLHY